MLSGPTSMPKCAEFVNFRMRSFTTSLWWIFWSECPSTLADIARHLQALYKQMLCPFHKGCFKNRLQLLEVVLLVVFNTVIPRVIFCLSCFFFNPLTIKHKTGPINFSISFRTEVRRHVLVPELSRCEPRHFEPPIFQGIVGCTPTNVPLWEIPIYTLYSGYSWFIIPRIPI